MGTRGLYGFRKNGEDKLTYNHFDSYPDWLGSKVVEFCKETSIEEMNKIFDNIILVDENAKPTRTQIVECIKYYDDSVSKQSVEDWYCLLRNTQGDLNVYKDGLQYMIDNQEFIKDSLFCEYAYIINLDTNCLEFYLGFQKKPCISNRYGTDDDNGYYPCKMVAYYPIEPKNINSYSVEYYVNNMNELSKEEYK